MMLILQTPPGANLTTAAIALFSYTSNDGEQYLAGVDDITGGRGVWYVTVLGASSPKGQFHSVSNLAQMDKKCNNGNNHGRD